MTKGTSHVTDEQGIALATASAVILTDDGSPPEWVKLFPYGTIRGRDGRGPYTVRDEAHGRQIITATTAYQAGADAPVDYEHQTQKAEKNGQPAPAAAWFKDFDARPDGVYARTEWTGRAAQHLAAKEYRYISPTFAHATDGTVLRIVGAGLTNLPNFEIPAIASQTTTGPTEQGAPMHPDLYKRLRAALGLADDTSEEAVVTHCQSLADGAKAAAKRLGLDAATSPALVATAAQAAVTALAASLKLGADATFPAIATAAQQLGAQIAIAGQIDLTKYVPMEAHVAVASQLAELQGKVSTTDAEREVDAAVKAGKITPALKDWALAMASQSLDAFKAYVAKAPVLVSTAGQTTIPAIAGGAQKLSEDELAVASQLNLTPEQYAKAKEGK